MLQLSTIRTHQNLLRLPFPMCSLWSRPSINCLPKPTRCSSKCAHCSQNHPANYKGCSIYKELQRRKISSTLSKRIHTNFNTQTTNVQSSHPPDRTFPNQPTPQTQTYAQATSNASANNAPPPTTDTQPLDLNKLMTNFLDEFKNVINPLISL